MNNQKLHLEKGKPFMILEYDPVTGVPLRCEFGLSEAKNVYLSGVEGAIPEPFLYASDLPYAKKLNLNGVVAYLANWATVTTNEHLSGGGMEFSVDFGANWFGHEILHFIYTPSSEMAGEIINEEVNWGGRVSDVKAFKLIRKYNSSTIE